MEPLIEGDALPWPARALARLHEARVCGISRHLRDRDYMLRRGCQCCMRTVGTR